MPTIFQKNAMMLLKKRSLIGFTKGGTLRRIQNTLILPGMPMERLQTSLEPWIWLGTTYLVLTFTFGDPDQRPSFFQGRKDQKGF